MFDEPQSHTQQRRRSSSRRQGPARAPWRIRFLRVANFGILAVGAMAFFNAVADAPALSPGLRVAPLDLDWRPLVSSAFYDNSQYLAERVYALLWSREEGPSEGELTAALALSLRAVEAAPADAYHWTLLAGVAGAAGFTDAARSALARSAQLAPNNAALAIQRLRLFDLNVTPLDDETRAMVETDLAVAQEYSAAALRTLLEATPQIREAVPAPADPAARPSGQSPAQGGN